MNHYISYHYEEIKVEATSTSGREKASLSKIPLGIFSISSFTVLLPRMVTNDLYLHYRSHFQSVHSDVETFFI